MTPAVVAWVERTRAAQGIGPRVTDPDVLDQVAALIAPVEGVMGRAKAS